MLRPGRPGRTVPPVVARYRGSTALGVKLTPLHLVACTGDLIEPILFGFPYQTVRLKHESISREAFGNGILFVIDNIAKKPSGFYKMEDLLLPYFNLNENKKDTVKNKYWWQFWEEQ